MIEGLEYNSEQKMFVSHCESATIELGRLLGSVFEEGDNIILTGDLGAGKTQMTKGIADALGVQEDITSPTFTIQMIYQSGNLPLYHFDLYRVQDADELGDCGLWDVLGDDGVCIMEWGEQFAEEIGDERVDVIVERRSTEGDTLEEPARSIRFVAHDSRGTDLINNLVQKFIALV